MAINHADNWQKKPAARPEYSDVLRQQRQTLVRENSKQAARTMHQLQTAKMTEKVEKSHVSTTDVKQPVAAGRDVPQTVQKARGEVQAEAVRHSESAARGFLENRDSAARLKQLEMRPPSAKGSDPATRAAVTEKGAAAEMHIAKQTAGQQAPELARASADAAAREAARQAAAKLAARAGRQRTDDGRRTTEDGRQKTEDRGQKTEDRGQRTDDGRQTTKVAAQAAQTIKPQEIARTDSNSEVKDGDKETEDPSTGSGRRKKEEGEAKRSGGVYAKTTNAGGELNALLGGFAGGSENEGQGEPDAVAPVAELGASEIPELDPHTHIYNEYDESHPGVEMVMSKARLFDRTIVQQKLVEIANFDRDLEFKLKGLSERVVGDLKGEITLAHFHKSVYGGLIG